MSSKRSTAPKRGPQKVTSAAAWKKRATHTDITLPSGAVVDVRLPNLPEMVKSGTLPNPLLEAAVKQQTAKEVDAQLLEDTWDYIVFIVPRMVTSPEVTEDDVKDLPPEDLEMLVSFANRTNDMDAAYRQLGGLDKLQAFREARGIWIAGEDDEDAGAGGEAASDLQ